MKVAIIGGGITGLVSAYYLSQKGHQTTIFEKENYLGGLAAGFQQKGWSWYLDNFFHHLFVSDWSARRLINKLGLKSRLIYLRPKTSIFKNNQICQFDSSVSLLKFPFLSFKEKIRTGLVTAYLRTTNDWRPLEKVTAAGWLRKYYGKPAYKTLWQPLLEAKFGKEAEKISMAWFWGRLKKRSVKLGYLNGGFQVLINRLAEEIKKSGGKVYLNREISDFNQLKKDFYRIIITSSSRATKMLGAVNLILVLKEKFLTGGTYWLNINDPGFPFVAVVEQTNFVDKKYYGGNNILYVGGYYPQNHRYFKMSASQIYKEFLPYLKKINPQFDGLSVTGYELRVNKFAQPIIPVNYSQILPKIAKPEPNVFLANMQMVYPWDRGINYAIELGEKTADLVE